MPRVRHLQGENAKGGPQGVYFGRRAISDKRAENLPSDKHILL